METMSTGQRPNLMPELNKPAPDFEAVTTHGNKKLSDYRGKWLVLFSHPADFTPVCTTEFIAFAKRHDEFQALNTELLGLSIDSHRLLLTSPWMLRTAMEWCSRVRVIHLQYAQHLLLTTRACYVQWCTTR